MATTRETEHGVEVGAPAEAVYRLVADVANWPVVFPPTVHVEHVERGPRSERIRIWATANGEVRNWTSRRELDPAGLVVRFRQEVSRTPVAGMGGAWVVEPRGPRSCSVRLTHDFTAVGDDPAAVAWISLAVDRNSTAELAALKAAAERAEELAGLTLTFDDAVLVEAPAAEVYAFIDRADRWPERLPHVAAARLTERRPGAQVLEMDTRTADGATHTTKSVRVCLPPDRIVYKQSVAPALLDVHTGRWRFEEVAGGTLVTATHTVVVAPSAIAGVLGPDATVETATGYLRTALGRNSTATMLAAKAHAERARAGTGSSA